MLLYNVTITIDLDVAAEWLQWMKETHIPDVMATGMFVSYRLCRLTTHEHKDAEIYTAQYMVKDMEHLLRYQREFAPELQKDIKARFDNRYAIFRTVMEVIDHNEAL